MSPRMLHKSRERNFRFAPLLLAATAAAVLFAACGQKAVSPSSSPVYSDSALDGVEPRDVTVSTVDEPDERKVNIVDGGHAGGAPSALRVLGEDAAGGAASTED